MPAEKAEAVREPPEFPDPPIAAVPGLVRRLPVMSVRLALLRARRPAFRLPEWFEVVRPFAALVERPAEPRPPPDRCPSVAAVADAGAGDTKARVPGAICASSGWPAFRRVVVAVIA
jgi:hypothetical protein